MTEQQPSSSARAAAAAAAMPSAAQAIEFLTLLQHLKTQKRTGWVKRGVAGPESIADHMYRMGLMAMLVQGTQYDYHRCIKLALVHDVAEAIVGDITPTCGVSDADKFQLEAAAVQRIKAMLGGACLAGEEIEALWHEYEQGQSPEARLVKDFDKLEMILQAHEYEGAQGKVLQEFFDSTAGKWRTELGQSWAEEIYARRRQRQQQQQAAEASGGAAAAAENGAER
ncbi:HD domain-containing 2-like [Chlorella sorokiniana]|uniref:5'-deoxynucleotidase n=1 Tax=Chlorella sorokiniana TaxID=3076 RepID=A0A2P6TPZ0_CHLSO|nr:HD domain-containing 2-like [Chlorella sorokiniana]|eukprot:PRW56098.1 HD domain-containing 2-like [Chlorella sorokiniana]